MNERGTRVRGRRGKGVRWGGWGVDRREATKREGWRGGGSADGEGQWVFREGVLGSVLDGREGGGARRQRTCPHMFRRRVFLPRWLLTSAGHCHRDRTDRALGRSCMRNGHKLSWRGPAAARWVLNPGNRHRAGTEHSRQGASYRPVWMSPVVVDPGKADAHRTEIEQRHQQIAWDCTNIT